MKVPIKFDAWLKLAKNKKIKRQIKEDPILPLYGIIIKQFSDWHRIEWKHAVVALHIVYGWMPTIPNFSLPEKLTINQQKEIVKLLNTARSEILNANEIDELKSKLVNNSVVGTSKLLHLLAPKKYPIWDKRVARAWFGRKKINYDYYNSSEKYLAYLNTLSQWQADKRFSKQLPRIKKLSSRLKSVSKLRLLELVLFNKKS